MKENKTENKLLILLSALRAKNASTYASLFIVGMIGIAILITISELGQIQDTRSRASELNPQPAVRQIPKIPVSTFILYYETGNLAADVDQNGSINIFDFSRILSSQ